ncbi:MAG TPA: MBL fold metallo-hydrolase [Gemmatimonadaceae bacterium]
MTPSIRLASVAMLAAAASALALGAAHSQRLSRHDGVTVTFLANEGVMLEGGGRKVLIDALFLKYKTGFALPADSTQRALQGARPPFHDVDLVLATHHHGDHFHPAPMAAHLRANPGATLLSTRQVVDSLRGRIAASDPVSRRILARALPDGAHRREVVDGITVELLGLRHHDIDHLGYIVEIGGRRVLHVGDTDRAERSFPALRLDTARIDVALLPEWMVRDERGRAAIERWIGPKHVVAFHVGEGDGPGTERAVGAAYPGAITFVRPLETHRW